MLSHVPFLVVRSPGPGALELIGASPAAARLRELVRRAASGAGGILIIAPQGTEPEPIARHLHTSSERAAAPYVVVDCATADSAALERELFGAPSALPDVDLDTVDANSVIASVHGGTLFLNDVTELPAAMQGRLARIARDGQVRVGSEILATAVRFVASAPSTIDADVRDHRFRGDFYRRLGGTRIELSPLADRGDDLPDLAAHVVAEICAARGVPPRTFSDAARALIAAFQWPGNLAELRAVVDRVASATAAPVIRIEHLLPALRLDGATTRFVPAGNLRDARLRFEREYIASVLQHHDWRLNEAAQTLGIQRPNLYRKARQLGIPLTKNPD